MGDTARARLPRARRCADSSQDDRPADRADTGPPARWHIGSGQEQDRSCESEVTDCGTNRSPGKLQTRLGLVAGDHRSQAHIPARMTPPPGERRRVRIDHVPHSSFDPLHSRPSSSDGTSQFPCLFVAHLGQLLTVAHEPPADKACPGCRRERLGGCRWRGWREPDMRRYRARMISEPVARSSRSRTREVRPGRSIRAGTGTASGDLAGFHHDGPVPHKGLVLVMGAQAPRVLGGCGLDKCRGRPCGLAGGDLLPGPCGH